MEMVVRVWCLAALVVQCYATHQASDMAVVQLDALNLADPGSESARILAAEAKAAMTCSDIAKEMGKGPELFDEMQSIIEAAGKTMPEKIEVAFLSEKAKCLKASTLARSQCEDMEKAAENGGPKTSEQEESEMLKARMTQKMNILKSNMENDMADLELMREKSQKHTANLAKTATISGNKTNATELTATQLQELDLTQQQTEHLLLVQLDELDGVDAPTPPPTNQSLVTDAPTPPPTSQSLVAAYKASMASTMAKMKVQANQGLVDEKARQKEKADEKKEKAATPKAKWLQLQKLAQNAAKMKAHLMMRGANTGCVAMVKTMNMTLTTAGIL